MRKLATLVTAAVFVGCTWFADGSATTSAAPGSGGPCGSVTAASTHYQHVIWIWMENHSYSSIIGSSSAPYINSLATDCGLATNYHNISHPSLTNYIGATSGLSVTQVQPFEGDCNPSPECDTSAANIFGQVSGWKGYEESMPSDCDMSNSGEYAVRHDPSPYFTSLTGCESYDVPYPQLSSDLADNSLPAFAFITPNLIDDMHDGTVRDGDGWLAANLPPILNSTIYREDTAVIFITWDEGEGGSSNDCPTNTNDVGCHVATIVISPSTHPGTSSSRLFNHYSLLRTTEELLHLPLLGQAAHSKSMRKAFRL